MRDHNLLTTRLILLRATKADNSFIATLVADPLVRRYLGGPAQMSDLNLDVGEMAWIAHLEDTRDPIGLLSISKHKDGNDFELSYQFHPDAWGKGYGTEAAKAVCEFGFHELQHPRLIAETQSANTASCRLLERIGMAEERRIMRFDAEQTIFAMDRAA